MKHPLLQFGRGIALVVPLLALATNRPLSLINNCKIWQDRLLFSGNRNEVMEPVIMYQAVAQRTGLSNKARADK